MKKVEKNLIDKSFQAFLQNGIQAYQADNLIEAGSAFRQALEIDSNHDDANHLLGLVAWRNGENEVAVELMSKAIQINPGNAAYHSNLGNALKDLKRADEAAESYRKALSILPDFASAHSNLGAALRELGQLQDAMNSLQRAIALQPDLASAHVNLGNVLKDMGQAESAVESFLRAIEINPSNPLTYENLGLAFTQSGDLKKAVESHKKAVSLAPEDPHQHCSLGIALHKIEQFNDALINYDIAIDLNPGYQEAYNNRAATLQELGHVDEAINDYKKAISLKPDYSEAHNNLSQLLLLNGDYPNGWEEYNWRWKVTEFTSPPRIYEKPQWKGEMISGKRLLVWSELGIGDEVANAGMIAELIDKGIDVIWESDARLTNIFSRSFPNITCIAKGDKSQDFDLHIPAGGLGQILRPTLDSFTKAKPYLVFDLDTKNQFRNRYQAQHPGLLIGLAWQSNSPSAGQASSVSLAQLSPILETANTTFVNLQYGDTSDQRAAFAKEFGEKIIHDDSIDQMKDLDLFSAQVAAMDLVISIDNSTAHLAGALGIPTWVLLRKMPYWLWGLNRDDSLWCPSARLFRQNTVGDWIEVVERATIALVEITKQKQK